MKSKQVIERYCDVVSNSQYKRFFFPLSLLFLLCGKNPRFIQLDQHVMIEGNYVSYPIRMLNLEKLSAEFTNN